MKNKLKIVFFFLLIASCGVIAQNKEEVFSIPSGFTPNGDGKSDSLVVSGSGIKKYVIKIYNNWGEVMAELSDDKNKSWNGEYKDVAQPAGVYVWTAQVEFESCKRISKNGEVTLIR